MQVFAARRRLFLRFHRRIPEKKIFNNSLHIYDSWYRIQFILLFQQLFSDFIF